MTDTLIINTLKTRLHAYTEMWAGAVRDGEFDEAKWYNAKMDLLQDLIAEFS